MIVTSQASHDKAKEVFRTPNASRNEKTPDAGFEPATNGLTVHCSTAELIRNKKSYVNEQRILMQTDFAIFLLNP